MMRLSKMLMTTIWGASLLALAAGSAWAQFPNTLSDINTSPIATIRSPVDGAFYNASTEILLSAIGTDREDRATDLTYWWTISLVRGGSFRERIFESQGPTGSFAMKDSDVLEDMVLEVQLRVTDTLGLSDTAVVILHPSPNHQPSHPVQPGDVLLVSIYAGGERQEEFSAQISPAGTVTMPLIGEVGVAGLTAVEMSGKMQEALERDYFVEPQVMVTVKEYVQKVYVSGEVMKPGAYGLHDGLTVLNACILAGGFTDYAAPNRVKVTRKDRGQIRVFTMDLSKVRKGKVRDLVLQSGDRIDVPHRLF